MARGKFVTGRVNDDEVISEILQSLRRIFKAIQDYSQDVVTSFGITGPQLWALKTIFQHGGLPLGELSKAMLLHRSTVTGVVDRLEAKGYVERDRDPDDRRVIKVILTPAGQDLVKRAPHPVQGKIIYGLKKLKGNELRLIFDSVEKLVEIAEAKDVKATFFFNQE
jgi:DNA-binding MarR family transcriptional regulator